MTGHRDRFECPECEITVTLFSGHDVTCGDCETDMVVQNE